MPTTTTRTRTRKKTSQPVLPALERLSMSGARLFVLQGTQKHRACIMGADTCHNVSQALYDALVSFEWITFPRTVGQGIAECYVTQKGKDALAVHLENKKQFSQLPLPHTTPPAS